MRVLNKDEALHSDPRIVLEDALGMLADQLRDWPMLPCDAEDASIPDADALRETSAIQLPRKHCGFS